ncbi:MAG TPA: hypothetical protein VE684_19335 [Crenalkalicoccus sp.]|nr:hypothetical protein [Crenalkalicoccus sp.]
MLARACDPHRAPGLRGASIQTIQSVSGRGIARLDTLRARWLCSVREGGMGVVATVSEIA